MIETIATIGNVGGWLLVLAIVLGYRRLWRFK